MENTYKFEVRKSSNYLKVLSISLFTSTLLMYIFGASLFKEHSYAPLYTCFILYILATIFFSLHLKFIKKSSTLKTTIIFIVLLLFLPILNLIMVYLWLAIFPIINNYLGQAKEFFIHLFF